MKRTTFILSGVSSLLMHSSRLVDPLDRWSKELRRISGKRKKTDADHEEMSRIEFLGSIYLMTTADGLRPCIPSALIEGALLGAGRTRKMGKQVQSGVFVEDDARLMYDGPQDVDGLWRDEQFRLRVPARVGQVRVMRTRPRFHNWKATVIVSYHESDVDAATVRELMTVAGEVVGIGDWRPKFGRFTVE